MTGDLIRTAGSLDVPVYVHTGSHAGGAPSQLTLAAAKYPQTRFVLGHCGSTDYAHDMTAIIQSRPGNVWFEISLARPWAVNSYVTRGDRTRFLFGTFAPRNDPALELRHFDAALSVAEYPDVYGGNLLGLLGMDTE
ncbi:MAG: amidohydrolase family protein [Pirellulales bacterium]|nr:amidohydrolase family protein [Pirellulales bacterium]